MSSKVYLIVYIIFAIISLFVIEQILNIFILYKSLLKIIFFVIIPFFIIEKTEFFNLLNLKKKNKRKISFILSILVFLIIIITYFILSYNIDLGTISSSLIKNTGVNGLIFPFVAFYIIFFNSFIEEFFFRGFLFFNLFDDENRVLRYCVTSFLFSFYHIGIFFSWFSFSIFLLALVGLFVGGLIFCYINEKNKTIINSYLVHIFADIAIIVIGIKMFYF